MPGIRPQRELPQNTPAVAECARAGSRAECKEPRAARPTLEAMAVDLFSTVRQAGYPIEVLPGYAEIMNRYAFLMVE